MDPLSIFLPPPPPTLFFLFRPFFFLSSLAALAQGQSGTAATGESSTSAGSLMTAEERSTGAVEGRIYAEYLRAAGSKGVLAGLVGLFFISNFSVQLQQW